MRFLIFFVSFDTKRVKPCVTTTFIKVQISNWKCQNSGIRWDLGAQESFFLPPRWKRFVLQQSMQRKGGTLGPCSGPWIALKDKQTELRT